MSPADPDEKQPTSSVKAVRRTIIALVATYILVAAIVCKPKARGHYAKFAPTGYQLALVGPPVQPIRDEFQPQSASLQPGLLDHDTLVLHTPDDEPSVLDRKNSFAIRNLSDLELTLTLLDQAITNGLRGKFDRIIISGHGVSYTTGILSGLPFSSAYGNAEGLTPQSLKTAVSLLDPNETSPPGLGDGDLQRAEQLANIAFLLDRTTDTVDFFVCRIGSGDPGIELRNHFLSLVALAASHPSPPESESREDSSIELDSDSGNLPTRRGGQPAGRLAVLMRKGYVTWNCSVLPGNEIPSILNRPIHWFRAIIPGVAIAVLQSPPHGQP